MTDRTERPCDGYYQVMARVPGWYHKEPPPREGMRLEVVGSDGRPSVWFMPAGLAAVVARKLEKVRGVSSLLTPYDGHEALEAG